MRFISEMFHPNGTPSYYYKWVSTIDRFLTFAVYQDGRVCISILHTPGDDPLGYETAAERWSPVQSIEKILLSVVSMLAGESGSAWLLLLYIISLCACAEPNDESGANVDASVSWWLHMFVSIIIVVLQKMWRDNRQQFNEIAQTLVRKSLGIEWCVYVYVHVCVLS